MPWISIARSGEREGGREWRLLSIECKGGVHGDQTHPLKTAGNEGPGNSAYYSEQSHGGQHQ